MGEADNIGDEITIKRSLKEQSKVRTCLHQGAA